MVTTTLTGASPAFDLAREIRTLEAKRDSIQADAAQAGEDIRTGKAALLLPIASDLERIYQHMTALVADREAILAPYAEETAAIENHAQEVEAMVLAQAKEIRERIEAKRKELGEMLGKVYEAAPEGGKQFPGEEFTLQVREKREIKVSDIAKAISTLQTIASPDRFPRYVIPAPAAIDLVSSMVGMKDREVEAIRLELGGEFHGFGLDVAYTAVIIDNKVEVAG